MTAYFDTTADKNMLPPSIRAHGELANVAAMAEADVVGHYTDNPPYSAYTAYWALLNAGTVMSTFAPPLGYSFDRPSEDVSAQGQPSGATVANVRVYLRGYKADASSSSVDPNLKQAMKRTIAEVIRWRINNWTEVEPGAASSTSSEGVAPRSKVWRPGAEDALPPDWDRWLRPYDSRPIPWGL